MSRFLKKYIIVIAVLFCFALFPSSSYAAGEIFSVTVPMNLPITMDSSGQVTTAQNAAITNNSSAAVKVTKVKAKLNGWIINPNLSPSTTKVDSKEIALWIQGHSVLPDGNLQGGVSNWEPIRKNFPMSISYDARLPAQLDDCNELIGHIVYTFVSLERVTDDGNYILNIETGTIVKYIGTNKNDLVVPSTLSVDGQVYQVKTIGENAFQNQELKGSLTISQGIKTIGARAFYGNDLKYVGIPNSISTIGSCAFCYNRIGSFPIWEGRVTIDNYNGGIPNLESNAFNNNYFFQRYPAPVEYLRSAPSRSSLNSSSTESYHVKELYFIDFDENGQPVFDEEGYLVCDVDEIERLGYLEIFIEKGLLPAFQEIEVKEKVLPILEVDPLKEGDTSITGKTNPGATIQIENSSQELKTQADNKGDFIFDLSPLKADEIISIRVVEDDDLLELVKEEKVKALDLEKEEEVPVERDLTSDEDPVVRDEKPQGSVDSTLKAPEDAKTEDARDVQTNKIITPPAILEEEEEL
ncbi:MAG TPA: leucine-rich repeat protein [Clostridia bacterium]|nr:leucine-rich repeat protein [Clostridia bacterium]